MNIRKALGATPFSIASTKIAFLYIYFLSFGHIFFQLNYNRKQAPNKSAALEIFYYVERHLGLFSTQS